MMREVNPDMKRILPALLALILMTVSARAAVISDAKGREIDLPRTPQRVVSLLGSYGNVWLEAGGTLSGTTEDAVDAAGAQTVNLGSHSKPDMELLFSLEPDFVILSADTAAHPAIGDVLAAAGVPHGYFSMQTWQEYMEMMEAFTSVTGWADLYERARAEVENPIRETIERAQANENFGKNTALLLRTYVASVKAKGSEGTVAGQILEEMGLVNIADGDSSFEENLTMEAVMMADPDWIFVVSMGADQQGAMRTLETTLLSNPAWSTLTAVREGRYAVLDRELFQLRPNGRWAEAYEAVYELIYEE